MELSSKITPNPETTRFYTASHTRTDNQIVDPQMQKYSHPIYRITNDPKQKYKTPKENLTH